MRSRFGESLLASICRCLQDFNLSPTLFTFSLSLFLLSFIYSFIYAKLVAFPVPDPNPAPKSLRGKFSPSDKAPALQISFLLNLFHLLSLPIQTEKKNLDFLSTTQPSQWILVPVPATTVRFSFLAFSARL